MKSLIFVLLSVISFVAFGQEAGAPDKIGEFMAEWYWVVGGLILVFEYLVGISKLKSNSTIDLLLNAVKMFAPKKKND